MNSVEIQCPYCWQKQTIDLEEDVAGSFVQDCEVCCKPWEVAVERDQDGNPHISLQPS